MNKIIFAAMGLAFLFGTQAMAQYEYKIVTSVESIVPMGLGRSRVIENNGQVNAEELTTERNNGNDAVLDRPSTAGHSLLFDARHKTFREAGGRISQAIFETARMRVQVEQPSIDRRRSHYFRKRRTSDDSRCYGHWFCRNREVPFSLLLLPQRG